MEMYRIEWASEPDPQSLREAYEELPLDPKAAQKRLEELADQGSVMSMWYLADGYMNGKYFEKDLERAKFWFKRAQPKWPMASYYLGVIYLEAKAFIPAAEAFSEGRNKGCMPATYRLAKQYYRGLGLNRDLKKYQDLLKEACKNGHLFSKRDLATFYLSGKAGLSTIPRGVFLLASLIIDLIIFVALGIKSGPHMEERLII